MQSPMPVPHALLVNVPLRNTSFVGRTALLRAVEEQLDAQDTAAVLPHALHGMGGVGKSQLALEYVYRHQQNYRVICWIPAERESLILTVLADLAARLRLVPAVKDGSSVPAANTAVPVFRELDGETLARGIRPDGTLSVAFDGLRIPVALPPLASAILPLIDGQRSVGPIGAVLAERGTKPDTFAKAWRDTFTALVRVNRVLLAARP